MLRDNATDAATFLVHHLNSLLAPQCAPLTLASIRDVRRLVLPTGQVSPETLTVTLQTNPGEGVFEATVRRNLSDPVTPVTLLGPVVRLNLYGNQSRCVDQLALKPFCYCH